jgi:hypothetical protein
VRRRALLGILPGLLLMAAAPASAAEKFTDDLFGAGDGASLAVDRRGSRVIQEI